jgi:hypothetical protein
VRRHGDEAAYAYARPTVEEAVRLTSRIRAEFTLAARVSATAVPMR